MRAAYIGTVAVLFACAQPAPRPSTPMSCVGCHDAQHAAHATSRHGSLSSGFRASFATARDRAWCIACHDGGDGGFDGIACVGCHRGEHRARVDEVVCAGCHQFGLPPSLQQAGLSQTTIDENGGKGCVRCHLDGHRFRGGHDADFAARAIDVDVEHRDDALHFTIRATNVGHAVPTGDPFRVLTLTTCADVDCHDVIARKNFGRIVGGADTRPRPGADVSTTLPAADVVAWRLVLRSSEPALVDEPHTVVAHDIISATPPSFDR